MSRLSQDFSFSEITTLKALIAGGGTAAQTPAPTTFPTATPTTITSAILASDGVTLTIVLSQAATINGGAYSLVNGVIDTITWTNPTTALTTRTGTLATPANQGDVVRLSVVATFTTPALAAAASIVVTNNSTVAPAQPSAGAVDTTPTVLASFTGAAGAQPTGASAIAFRGNNGSANGSALDGSGHFTLNSGTNAFAMFEGLSSPLADGAYTFVFTSPKQVALAWGESGAGSFYFAGPWAQGPNGNGIYVGYFAGGNYGGNTVTGGTPYPTASNWTINIAGGTVSLLADGVDFINVTDPRYAMSGFIGFGSVGANTDTLVLASLTYQTPAQIKAAQAAALLAAAQTAIGPVSGSGVYGEVTPADNLPRGIYGPASVTMNPTFIPNSSSAGSYFVRGMSGVTRMTITGPDANLFYNTVDNCLTPSNHGNYGAAAGTQYHINVVFDNSLSGGTDVLTLPVTVTMAGGEAYAGGGCFYCDNPSDGNFAGLQFQLNGNQSGDNSYFGTGHWAILGADANLFQYTYCGPIALTDAARPVSAHYGKHTVQFTDGGSVTTPPVDLYILGPQSPRAKINYAPIWDNSDPGDAAFTITASSERASFGYTLFGAAADLFVVSLYGVATLRPGASLVGKGGTNVSGVLCVDSHGIKTYLPISVPVAAGTVLPASNMTAVVAAGLTNYIADPNTTVRRAVTPSVAGMSGPTWSLTQNNVCVRDAEPNPNYNPYGLRHKRYVQNADGSVDALCQLSAQTDTLTLKARSGGTVCTNSFDVVVGTVPETMIYVGQGMEALHGVGIGFEHLAPVLQKQRRVNTMWVNPHILIYGNADPAYYNNDMDTYTQGLKGPGKIEGVAVNGRYPRLGGFWNTGLRGGVDTDEKGYFSLDDGDWEVRNIEFSHIFQCNYQGFGSPSGQGGIAVRRNGNTRGNLLVDNCFFHDLDQAVEAGDCPGSVTITNCTIENYTGAHQGGGAMHGIYIGNIWQLTVDRCLFHRGFNGHLIKCRAWHSTITNTRCYDGVMGGASNQIDLCDGGISEIAHNVLHAFRKQNFCSLQFGEEMQSGPRGKNRLNSHDNLFISNYPANVDSKAISARTIIDPVTGEQGLASSTNDTFYGYGPATPNHPFVQYWPYDYNPNYTYGTSQDQSPFNQPFPVVNPTVLTAQPALDYTYAHNFIGFVTKPGISYFPYDGEGSKNWLNIDGVQIIPGVLELSVAAGAANGTVVDTPTINGNLYCQTNPAQPDPKINPFADGNNTWQLRTDIQSYLGAAFTYPVAPAGMFTINAQTGALTYHGGAAAGTTQYVGRECKNNTNGTIAWDYQYVRVTA